MDYQKILNMLIEIEGQLDDAYYSLPDYNANMDSQSYIDGARSDLYNLKDEIERKMLDDKKDHDLLYNKEAGDGEGRLKGNN
jgi:hypothetical protein|tara:strand:+ start:72 stop:317 length:246 start_codon:yes stop_codon:yes gene_type:complete